MTIDSEVVESAFANFKFTGELLIVSAVNCSCSNDVDDIIAGELIVITEHCVDGCTAGSILTCPEFEAICFAFFQHDGTNKCRFAVVAKCYVPVACSGFAVVGIHGAVCSPGLGFIFRSGELFPLSDVCRTIGITIFKTFKEGEFGDNGIVAGAKKVDITAAMT